MILINYLSATYNPIAEYGGLGIRFGPNGKAYNVSGNTGLQVILKNKSKVLIGTNDAEALAAVLARINKLDYMS